MKGREDERTERKDSMTKSGGQRGQRRRDQGRGSNAQPGDSNGREGLNQDRYKILVTESELTSEIV